MRAMMESFDFPKNMMAVKPVVVRPIAELKQAGELIHAKLERMPRETALLYMPGLRRMQELIERWSKL
jgi:hypothetical protein